MIKSREKHAGYEVKDLSFWRLNYNSEEIEPKFGEMIVQKNWVNFINWSHMELKFE